MQRAHDLTDQKFNHLVALRPHVQRYATTKASGWICRCDCGNEFFAPTHRILSGRVKSCGCLKGELLSKAHIKHGHWTGNRPSPEWVSWRSAINRCTNQNDKTYARYGGRGITFYEGWRDDFPAFFKELGPKPPGTSLDRIDTLRGYEPGNCRWATPKEQSNNLRNNRFVEHCGERLTIRDAADRFTLPYDTFRNALYAHGHYDTALGRFALVPL